MSYNNIQGLEPLRGFYDLTPEEKQKFLEENDRVLSKYKNSSYYLGAASALYDNNKFINRFGQETFDSMPNYQDREDFFRQSVIDEATVDLYGNDKNYRNVISQLTTEGKLELLQSGYQNDELLSKQIQGIKEDQQNALNKKEEFSEKHPILMGFTEGYAAPVDHTLTDGKGNQVVQKRQEFVINNRNATLDKILSKDTKRKESSVSNQSSAYLDYYRENINKGELSEEQIDQQFDEIFSNSNHYNVYKNSKILRNLTPDKKIKLLSNVAAIANQYGDQDAANYIAITMQNYVADNRDLATRAKNAYLGQRCITVAQIVGDIPKVIHAAKAPFMSDEEQSLWLQGKDKNGNDLPIWQNVAYWEKVKKYGTFIPELHKLFDANGGVSLFKNTTRYGEEFDLSWKTTPFEMYEQAGYIKAEIYKMLPFQYGINALAKAGKISNIAAKFGHVALLTEASYSMGYSEGYGAYESAKQQGEQAIYNEIYEKAIEQFNSEEQQEQFNNYLKQLKEIGIIPTSEAELNKYKEEWVQKLTQQIASTDEYKEKFNLIESNAVDQFILNTYLSTFKHVALNATLKDYLFTNETRSIWGNNKGLTSLFTFTDDGAKILNKTALGRVSKSLVKNFGSEALDEHLDEDIKNFTNGFYNMETWLSRNYDPKTSEYTLKYGIDDVINGLDSVQKGILSKEAFHSAFIGGFSGAGSTSVNVSGAIGRIQELRQNAKDRREGKEVATTPYTLAEKLNFWITNPLISDEANYQQNLRQARAILPQINETIAANKETLENIIGAMQPILDKDKSISMLELADAKQNQILQLLFMLDSFKNDPVFSQTPAYKDALSIIDKVANDNLIEEEAKDLVAQFLSKKDNQGKNITTEEALAQIKQNVDDFLTASNKLNEITQTVNKKYKKLDDSTKRELIVSIYKSDNYKERLKGIQESMGYRFSDSYNMSAEYGTKTQFNEKRRETENLINSIQRDIARVNKKINQIDLNDQKNANKQIQLYSLQLNKKALEEQLRQLQIDQERMDVEAEHFKEHQLSNDLSVQELESLSAKQLQRMYNEYKSGNYKNTYSKKSQQAIEEFFQSKNFEESDINDAVILQDRIKNLEKIKNIIHENPEYVAAYKQALQQNRTMQLIGSHIVNQVQNFVEQYESAENYTDKKKLLNSTSYDFIKALIRLYPEYKKIIGDHLELSQLHQDISNVINKIEDSQLKNNFRTSIWNIIKDAETKQEALQAINEAINSEELSFEHREQLKTFLNDIKELERQKQSTKVQEKPKESNKSSKENKESNKESDKKEETNTSEKKESQEEKESEEKNNEDKESNAKERPTKEGYKTIHVRFKGPKIYSYLIPKDVNLTIDNRLYIFDVEGYADIVSITDENYTETENGYPLKTLEPGSYEIKDKDATYNDIQPIPVPTSSINNEQEFSHSLKGARFTGFNGKELKESGVEKPFQSSNDQTKEILQWLEAANINYQYVIDNELSKIIKVQPKIQFLAINGRIHIDKPMADTCLLVVEYTKEVAKIHKTTDSIIEANGKPYLVIGMLGFSPSNQDQSSSYHSLWSRNLKKIKRDYFEKNPSERFYVDENLHTEISSIDNGWLVRQTVNDQSVNGNRSIKELLESPDRNPKGLKLENINWGIQKSDEFYILGYVPQGKLKAPRDTAGNLGNVFMLIETANEDYIPVLLNPTRTKDLIEGSQLKDDIIRLINDLTSLNHTERQKALYALMQYLHLDKDGDNILIGKEGNNSLSIVKGNTIIRSFKLDDSNFSRTDLINTIINDFNPRININTSVLRDQTLLQKYIDGGALVTDLAKLGTSNAGFTVYAVDREGYPIKVEEAQIQSHSTSSDYQRTQYNSIKVNGQTYRYRNTQWLDVNDSVITDEHLKTTLNYHRLIQQQGITSSYTDNWNNNYFIVDNNNTNPTIVAVSPSNDVKVLNSEEAKKILDYIKTKQNQEIREQNAKKALEEMNLETVDLLEDKEPNVDNAELIDVEDIFLEQEVKQESKNTTQEQKPNISNLRTPIEINTEAVNMSDMFKLNSPYFDILESLLDEKSEQWGNIPDENDKIIEYFKSKGIQTENIQNVEDWVNLVRECK